MAKQFPSKNILRHHIRQLIKRDKQVTNHRVISEIQQQYYPLSPHMQSILEPKIVKLIKEIKLTKLITGG